MYKCTGKKMSIRTCVISKFEKIILLCKVRFQVSVMLQILKMSFEKKEWKTNPLTPPPPTHTTTITPPPPPNGKCSLNSRLSIQNTVRKEYYIRKMRYEVNFCLLLKTIRPNIECLVSLDYF